MFYLIMGVQLIANLSVFSLFVFFLKEERVLQVTIFSRFLNPPALNMLHFSPDGIGFLLVCNNGCSKVAVIVHLNYLLVKTGPAASH